MDGVGELCMVPWLIVVSGAFNLAPEVDSVGDEWGVLAIRLEEDEGAVEGLWVEEGVLSAACAVVVVTLWDGAGVKLISNSALGMVIQLNLNSGTVSGSPAKNW